MEDFVKFFFKSLVLVDATSVSVVASMQDWYESLDLFSVSLVQQKLCLDKTNIRKVRAWFL